MAKHTDRHNDLWINDALNDQPRMDLSADARNEVVFVDSAVDDWQTLVEGLDSDAEVVVLEAGRNGVEQMAEALSGRSGIDAIHLVSHGDSGRLLLGNSTVDTAALDDYGTELATIGEALAEDGDLLLYGCNVAAGSEGEAFVSALAERTGADIAASDDLTGNGERGGDDELEWMTGQVDQPLTSLNWSDYREVLAATTLTFTSDGGVSWDDGIAEDGEGGSSDIAGIVIQVLNISDTSGTNHNDLAWQDNFDLGSGDGYHGLTDNFTGAGWLGMAVKSSDGSEFQLNGFDSFDYGWMGVTVAIKGYRDGSEVASDTFTSNSDSSRVNVSLGSGFDYVDEVRLVRTSGTDWWPSINNIVIDDAVPPNAAPTVSSTPSDVTVTEDTASNVDLSAASFADADGDSLTVTLAIDAGTFGTPADGSGVGVTETLVNSTTITLAGTAADINTYLDTASNIQYTGASNASGDNQATLTITPNDGTEDGTAATVNIDITAVNDAPTAGGVPTDVSVSEDTASNFDLSAVTVADVDGDSLTVTLAASAGTFTAASGGGVTVGGSGTGSLTLAGTAANINTWLDTAGNIQYTGASNANGDNAATFTINANDGTVNPQVGSGNIDITAVNDAPTATGVPSDVTVTEDTASNVDLSAVTVADVDGDSLTVTLAASAGTFAATSSGGVTVGGSGTGSLTLAGTAADINTFLDTLSNVQYTGASNASGDNAASFTINANDGTVNPQVGSANIDITAVNDAPTASGVPTDVSVSEDTASNFDLSAVNVADVDGDSLTVTLAASAGTFTAASGGGVTVGGSGTGSLTLAGTAANINTFLDTLSNVQYTGASNASGDDAATFTINAHDGTVNPQVGSGNIDITAVNDAPVFSGLDGAPSYTEGDPAVTLDVNVTVSDLELSGASDFAGASLTIARNGGANAADSFSFDTTGALFTVSGGNLQAGGQTFATFTNSSGTLTVDFTSSGTTATQALVNDVLQRVQYQNTSDDPMASAQLDWTFSDGNTGAQGSGGAQTATGSTSVSLTNVNDAPTLTATGGDPIYVEGAGASDLFNTVTADTVEDTHTTDRFSSMTLTVTNVSDGASEILRFDGSDVALTDGNSVVGTATNGLTVNVSLSGSTATVSFSGASLTEAQMQTLVDGLAYRNTSDNPTTGSNRVVTITQIVDDGGTAGGGVDTATPNLQSTVSLTAVNDAPVIGNLDGDNNAVQAGGSAVNIDAGGNATVSNVDSSDYNGGSLTIVDNGGNNTVNGNLAVDGTTVTAGGDGTIAAGETIAIGGLAIGTVHATDDGQGGNTLTIDFNSADATNARVQTLLQNLTWSAAAGSGAQTFTATLNDGDGTGGGGDQDTTANFTMTVGNLPVIGNLEGDSVTFTEGDPVTPLDQGGDATLSDADAPANLDGGNLTATVSANAVAGEDILTFDTTGTVSLAGTTAGSNVTVGGIVVGTLGNNVAAGNDLVVNLTTNATLARVQTLLRSVAYDNDSEAPTASTRTIDLTVTDNDGLTSAASQVSVDVVSVNDAPTLTATGADPAFTEDGGVAGLFSGTAIDAVESADNVSELTLTVSDLADGSDELLSVDGEEIALTDGTSGTTTANGFGYAVSLSGTTATVTLSKSDSADHWQDLVNGLGYRNGSDAPDTTARTVTLTAVSDTGGTANGGSDTTALGITSTVSMAARNDAPVLDAAQSPALSAITEDMSEVANTGTSVGDLIVNGSISDPDGGAVEAIAVIGVDNSHGVWQYTLDGGATWSDVSGTTGSTVDLTTTALLLDGSDPHQQVRFVPNADWSGTAAFSFVAWDKITGSAGGALDASTRGGTTTFSATSDSASITVTAVNDAPTATNLTQVTGYTEDPGSAVTVFGTAVAIADVDGDSLAASVTLSDTGAGSLASSGGSYDSATGTWSMTGDAASVEAAMNALVFTPTANLDTDITASVSVSDGLAAALTGTVTLDVTAVNDVPAISDTAPTRTMVEDGVLTFAASDFGFTDVDSGDDLVSITIVSKPANGTLFLDNDGSGTISAGDMQANDGTVISLADITKLAFKSEDDANGSGYDTFTWTVNDGTTSSTDVGTMTIDVTPVNDAPTLTATGADPTFTEDGAAASLFSGTSVSSGEAGQTIQGLTFTVSNVNDGSDESLNVDGTAIALVHGTSGTTATNGLGYGVSVVGTTVTVSVSGGALSTADAEALVDGMSYQNHSDSPSAGDRVVALTSVQDNGGTANGGDDTASVSVDSTVSITGVNDAPTLMATGDDPTFTEDGGAAGLFSGSSVSTAEAGQAIQGLTFTVSNVNDGSDESLNVDGTAIALTHGTRGATAVNGLTYAVSKTGTTATVSLTDGTLSNAAAEALVDGISYQNHSDAPNTGNRVVTITSLRDSGGTANGGDDTAALAIASTVAMVGVNDAPTGSVSINGTATQGNTLIADTTALDDADGLGPFRYVWKAEGEVIAGADQASYTLTSSDVGKAITVEVSYTDGFGTVEGPLMSAPTSAVAPLDPAPDPVVVTPAPEPTPDTPSGEPSVTETLTNPGDAPGSARLVENTGNANVVTATLPGGVSLTNQGARTAVDREQALADLIASIDDKQPDNLPDQTERASQWLDTRPDGTRLDVRTLTLTADGVPAEPIALVGNDGEAATESQEAFVIDVTGLPSGTRLQLDNIDFASIKGAVEIAGGAGDNVVIGDDAAQVIVLGEGDDALYGGGGDDTVGSQGGDDRLFGEAGDDTLFASSGANLFHGGSERDTVRFDGNRDDYVVTQEHAVITVQAKADPGDVNTLVNVESLVFADGGEALTYGDELEWIAGLYAQVLGRQGDVDGVQYWAAEHASGLSDADIALSFFNSQEAGEPFDTTTEAGRSRALDRLYESLLGREADAAGKAYWLGDMAAGHSLRDVVDGFMASAEMQQHHLATEQWDFIA
ncbi:DUF4347 domain-containing protein [Billgrantia azerbaijanica]|nr:DUF4347 domain-containing protein [Halomonas azerbaijanica]